MQREKNRNAKWWLEHIETWQKNNISQSEYCRQNDLNQKSFSNWKLKADKLHGSDKNADIPVFTSSPKPVPLIPVAISEQIEPAAETIVKPTQLPGSSCSGIILVFKTDYQISLAVDFNPETLKNLLATLAE